MNLPVVTQRIEPEDLAGDFRSSDPSHEQFLKRALAQDRARILRTHVLRKDDDDPATMPAVLGYYSLVVGTLTPDGARPAGGKSSPVCIIERFSVHAAMEGRGLAEHLLFDAFVRCHAISEQAGAIAVLAFAPNDRAEAFLGKLDFVALDATRPNGFVIPMGKVAAVVSAALSGA